MVVELKKVKITAGILKQAQRASINNMMPENVLGWVHHNIKKVLVYDDKLNQLWWSPYPRKIEVRCEIDQKTHYVAYISGEGLLQLRDTSFCDLENMTKLCKRLTDFKDAADFKGQIYF